MTPDDITVFAGSGSPRLAARICDYLDVPLGRSETLRFSDGNLFPRVLQNVRGQRVYVVQSTVFPTNDNFMELLFLVDALKRASADSDKKDEPRVSIRARVCADCIEAAGADRVVTMDLHAPQIQGFFHIPVDNLYALPVICAAIERWVLRDVVVVSPDIGFAKRARDFARQLGAPIAIVDKDRAGHDERATVLNIIGDVRDKSAVVVDDFTISGGTLVEVARALLAGGAKDVYAAVTHGVLTADAVARIDAGPLKRLLITDTVENQPAALPDKIEVASVAPLFAEAIRRIHHRESISAMFP